jgi:hypothetical protein
MCIKAEKSAFFIAQKKPAEAGEYVLLFLLLMFLLLFKVNTAINVPTLRGNE